MEPPSCCSEMTKALSDPQSVGFYVDDEENMVYIQGCCGGGCRFEHPLKFCPFCGEMIPGMMDPLFLVRKK